MASPITWREFPTAWATLACRQCGARIPEGQPFLIRSFARRYARFWCRACNARLAAARPLGPTASVA